MNKNTYKTKRKTKQRFLGLIIVLLISIIAIFLFSSSAKDSIAANNTLAPILKLTTNKTTTATAAPTNDVILVNKWHPIPENYVVDLVELSNGQSVDISIYPALQEMFDTARANGIYPVVASGYRTAEKQQLLMDEKIAAYTAEGFSSDKAVKKAKEWVAIPGTSEHQLGIAVDINADGTNSTADEVYGWLAQNAHKYGFICRYPAGKTTITGVNHEPWHYRYVGIDIATKIYQQNICLEEYLEIPIAL